MVANGKFELGSSSPEESGYVVNYSNGQRGNDMVPSLERSGSFRESAGSPTFNYGTSTSKGNASTVMEFPTLWQCLTLEPITLGDQKYTRFGELRRALGFSLGSVSDDGLFGASHSKLPSTMLTDELKQFKASVLEASANARNRAKKFDECLTKLLNYFESLSPKKPQIIERTKGSGVLKMGAQAHRNSQGLLAQTLDDRGQSSTASNRARTPTADVQTQTRTNGIPKRPLISGKDKDTTKGSSLNGDPVEERIRRLPAGGEGWDKKMKRKRSVSNVFPRLIDGDVELKRASSNRLHNDSALQSSDIHGLRSGSNSAGSNKPDGIASPGTSGHMTPNRESKKVSLSRVSVGTNKDRLLRKVNTNTNLLEDDDMASSNSVMKAKALRGQRTGPLVSQNSSPNLSHASVIPEEREPHLSTTKGHLLGGVNRKRPVPTESSSPPMAQWVGQRPQKVSRMRRSNILSPCSNEDESLVSPEPCTDADCSTRIVSGATPLSSKAKIAQYLKVKIENSPSPAGLSDSEETGIVENKLESVAGSSEVEGRLVNGYQRAGSPGLLTKNSRFLVKEEVRDGVRRQGRSGRSPSFSIGCISPPRDKLDNSGLAKPLRCTKAGSEKNGSKSGRPPLKKHSERKGSAHLASNVSSRDLSGESDDDRPEMLAAAQYACNACYQACNASFWKKMEPLFSLKLMNQSFLMQQLKSAEERLESLSVMIGLQIDAMEDTDEHQSYPEGGEKDHLSNEPPDRVVDQINQFQFSGLSCKRKDSKERLHNVIPLYQRVLSALIVEDDLEEFEDDVYGGSSPRYDRDETSTMGSRIFSNGFTSYSRSSIQVLLPDEMCDSNFGSMRSELQAFCPPLENDVKGSLATDFNANSNATPEHEYEQMGVQEKLSLELLSVGVYPEKLPDLAQGDDELINQSFQYEKQLYQELRKKRALLERLHKAAERQKELEERDLEQVAMNRLVELAYRKLLATRGSYASRAGVSKVPRNVSLAFIKRTLTRCQKFEDTGRSCFSEPALHNILLAGPISSRLCESVNLNGLSNSVQQSEAVLPGSAGAVQLDFRDDMSARILVDACVANPDKSNHTFAKEEPLVNKGKRKEVHLDDVGSNSTLRSTVCFGNTLLAGAKGKRSERERSKDLSGNLVAKGGRPSKATLKGDRKTKSKPKHKAGQLSVHPVLPLANGSSELLVNGSNRKREGLPGSAKESEEPIDLSNLPLPELDSIGDLGIDNELGGVQDLGSWFNFDDDDHDDDNLQDLDLMGLEIPMDDLSELKMIL